MATNNSNQNTENSIVVTIAGNSVGAYGSVVQANIEAAWAANPSLLTGGLLAKATILSTFPDLLTVAIAVHSDDPGRIGVATFKSIGSIAIAAAASAIAGALGAGVITTITAVGAAGYFRGIAGGMVWDAVTGNQSLTDQVAAGFLKFSAGLGNQINSIESKVNTLFTAAHAYQRQDVATLVWVRRDPLILDLDGDGLETHGIDAAHPIYFDHTGDGTLNPSGWVAADDGFLVLDRNGNGQIDDGTELFGDSTPLSQGGQALNGFHALAQEDSNEDGWVDAQDAHFGELRVWRDLNQNGVSEAGELLTLESLGIQGFRVEATPNYQLLDNGNVLADVGSYLRSGRRGEIVSDHISPVRSLPRVEWSRRRTPIKPARWVRNEERHLG